jgi:hypothetical protein
LALYVTIAMNVVVQQHVSSTIQWKLQGFAKLTWK